MKKLDLSRLLLVIVTSALFATTGCTKQARLNRHLQRGDKYFAASDYDKAELEYLNVLRIQRTNAPAVRGLANIYYSDELLPRAVAFLAGLKTIAPDDVVSRGKLARLYLTGGSVKSAREEADFVLQHAPDNEDALLVLLDLTANAADARVLRQRVLALQQKAGDKPIFHIVNGSLAVRESNPRAAEAEFKAALALDPKSIIAQWALGSLYLSQTNIAAGEPLLKAAADASPIRSARRLKIAALKVQNHDIEGAATILNEITKKAPDYAPAWIYSARLALDQKKYDQCAAALEHILSRVGDHYDALSMRAEVEMAQGKSEKAVTDLKRLTSVYRRSAPARYQLALALLAVKDTQPAIAALNEAVALDKNLTPAVLLLAELNIRQNNPAPAITSLNDLLKRQPKTERAYYLLATAYQADGKLDQALAVYDRAAKTLTNNAQAIFMSGVVLRQQGRFADARKVFEAILKSNPNDPPANAQLVDLDLQENKIDQAVERVQQWTDRSPNDAEPVFQMARIRVAQKDAKSAEPLLERVISLNPDAGPAYFMLAKLYYDSKQLDSALQKCDAAIARNPKDVSSLLLSSMILSEKGQFEQARDRYEKLLAVAPQNFIALNNLAALYSERFNQLDKAYIYARQAEELRPSDPTVADTYGWILLQRGDYNLALGLLREAALGRSDDPEIITHFGVAQYMIGDESAARATLERALKMAPSFNGRDQAEKALAFLNVNPASADEKTIASLEKRLEEKPADPVALSRLAAIYDRSNKTDRLVSIYEKALAANPKMGIASARLAEINQSRLKNPAKALELAKNARKIDSNDPEVAHIAGRIAAKSPDLKEQQWGLSLLQESSQKLPDDPQVAYDFAWASYSQGHIADAETSMKMALARGGNLPFAASAKRFLDFLPLAEPARAAQQQPQIDAALQTDPAFVPALVARAAIASQKGDSTAAIKTLDQVLSIYPGFAPAIRSLAILSASQSGGDNAKRLAIAMRARELFPEDPEVAKALGIAQYQAADFNKAVRTLGDLARKRPDDAFVQYYLGMAHYRLKQNKESKTALTNAVRLQANASFVPDAQKVLAELK